MGSSKSKLTEEERKIKQMYPNSLPLHYLSSSAIRSKHSFSIIKMFSPIDDTYLNFDIVVNTFGNIYYIYLVYMECEGCRLESIWLGQTSSPYKRRLKGSGYFNGFYTNVYMFIYLSNDKLRGYMKFNNVNKTDFVLDLHLSKIKLSVKT